MGEVYRARDTKLNRDVAIKVLPALFASDVERLARFTREAQTLASLNHPNIAHIHGLEESNGVRALVMELVEGEDLSQRIARGPIPIGEVSPIAKQIADALEAAHEQGVIHRDLKPANIKVRGDGTVKVLDFGLAKILETGGTGRDSGAGTENLTQSPTITSPAMMTGAGMILGTAAYMSPEQARGKTVDKRADIWAFGCVLYEMLAGRATFARDTLTDTLAAIVEREPDWRALPHITPNGVRRLLQRCLDKDPRQRLRDIGDARADLTPDRETTVITKRGAFVRSRSGKTVTALAPLAIATVIAASVVTGIWSRPQPSSDARPAPVRFSVPPPPGGAFVGNVESTYLALSPDGSQLAFIAAEGAGVRRIWLRAISAIDSRPLSGTEGASSPFWSPDGRAIAFFSGNKLKRVDLPEGAAVPLCDVPASGLTGTWGADGEILFASVEGDAIFSVSTVGGTPATLIKRDQSRGETRVSWPWFLPDGRRFLYLTRLRDGSGQVTLAERGRTPRPILPAISNVHWVDPDYLVFVREGILVGQRFDLATERVVGEPFSIAEPVDYSFSTARAIFATSRNGSVAYQSHKDMSRLIWSDRNGTQIGNVGTAVGYIRRVRLSQDGGTLLFDRTQPGVGTKDLFTWDFARGVETRLTSDPGSENDGLWLPDGRNVVFMADRGGPPHLFRKNLLTGAEDALSPPGRIQQPTDVSPDGKMVVYTERTAGGSYDVLALSLPAPGTPEVLLGSRFNEGQLQFSPDGRAVVFTSDESGRYEMYVAPFPAMGPKLRISKVGASQPRWSPAGHEIFYLTDDRHLVSVPVRTEPSIELGTPTTLFALPDRPAWGDFAVSPDGKRFLAVVSDVIASEQPLTVVLNWPAAIAR
jgi:serine/threonine protein kinase